MIVVGSGVSIDSKKRGCFVAVYSLFYSLGVITEPPRGIRVCGDMETVCVCVLKSSFVHAFLASR